MIVIAARYGGARTGGKLCETLAENQGGRP
jgi:hypothetical protein